jgi:hypothetical protein
LPVACRRNRLTLGVWKRERRRQVTRLERAVSRTARDELICCAVQRGDDRRRRQVGLELRPERIEFALQAEGVVQGRVTPGAGLTLSGLVASR